MYGFLADVTIAVHVAYVAFVVAGELLILLGWWRGWAWVRSFWFRTAHLLAIGAVVVVELPVVRCPLTIWDEAFRARAGQPVSGETFMSRLRYSLLSFEAPPWVVHGRSPRRRCCCAGDVSVLPAPRVETERRDENRDE